jgi:hypothetical protein
MRRLSHALTARPALAGGLVLLTIYAVTLAPSVTLWDSGEFLAAIRTLGIPHPPGTPLYVFVANVWAWALWPLDFAVAVNLASAVATVVGCAALARVFLRSFARAGLVAVATVVAGLPAAVWGSATEAEVYGSALAWVGIAMVLADTAWAGPRRRHLLAMLMGLAVPLHLSALVAAPAVILLAASDARGFVSLRAMLPLAAAFMMALAVGTARVTPAAVGALLAVVSRVVPPPTATGPGRWEGGYAVLLSLVGASFVMVMLVRAAHDPAVNQGNPSAWQALWDHVARRQYDVPPLWPRRAPLWLQFGNVVQYLDWQFGAGWSDVPGPSWFRTPITMAGLGLAAAGALWHRARDPRSFRAMAALGLLSTVGVVVVLNLRAGPSYGWGVLPPDAVREARERDYFFALAFLCWGLWMTAGAARVLARLPSVTGRVAAAAGVLFLVGGNVGATNRRLLPEAAMARTLGTALLASVPERGVVVVAGDNDAYGSWYAQSVLGVSGHVTTIVLPLLPARWYREEVARRAALLSPAHVGQWTGFAATLQEVARNARAQGRPLAFSLAVPVATRLTAGAHWRLSGLAYIEASGTADAVDREVTGRVAATIVASGVLVREGRDPTSRYVRRLLECPGVALASDADAGAALLESICNYR